MEHGNYIFVQMRFFKPLLYICTCLSLYVSAYAQDPYYININKLGGLPSNSIYDIFQDSKGFIWISSNEGLTRYDGFEFKTYTNSNQTSLAGNNIDEDRYGRIWYQNFDGYLYYVENDSLKSPKQSTTYGNSGFAIIDNRLLTLQKNGVDIFDLATLKVIKNIPLNLNYYISGIKYDNNYCLSMSGMFYKISPEGNVKQFPTPVQGSLAKAKNGVLIIKRNNNDQLGYEMTDKGIQKKFKTPNMRFVNGVDYAGGQYWLYTPNGVWVYNEAGENLNIDKPFFASQSISSVLKDKEGNYWLGTLDNGILFVPDLKMKLITHEGVVPNILLPVNNQLYIGTKDNAIYTYDVNTNNFVKKYKGDIRHEILCMLADTVNKNFYFSDATFKLADMNFHDVQDYLHIVKDLAIVDNKYCAFAATGLIGLMKLREDIPSPWDSLYEATHYQNRRNICALQSAIRGRAVAYNPISHTIYSGSNKGLFVITKNSMTEVKLGQQPLYTRKLIYFHGYTYLLTPQNQLYTIATDNSINNIMVAEEEEKFLNIRETGNNLYLLTNNGIKTLDTVSGTFKPVSIYSCVRSEEINDIAIVKDKLVIASDRGLIVLDNNKKPSISNTPGFTVNKVLVNGNKTTKEMLEHLSYSSNDIDIFYSILSFDVDNRYRLYYKINNGNWQSASNATRNLKFASLSPGAYDIYFELRSDNGKVFPKQTVSLFISKPFWIQWWFWGACFAVLSICGYAYYKWQTSLLKKKNALVLEKVELEKNLRSSMLTSIRAQMNPHFFYNALNTIQSFIFSDDKRNASTYLVKLSRLTRMILEMSEKESISLDEEIDALKLYLELEKMRFSNDFNYEIKVGKEVDSELIKIPSMIVQPYVENAIKHGLLHKNGNKLLGIEFAKLNGNLCVTIDDNGIGREKANELNQVKKEKHNPFSTEANSKRIELLNKERSKSIGIVYIDKTDENGNPSGTTVIISVPLT